MSKIVTEKLKPASSKKENIYLGIIIVFLILNAFLLIKMRKPKMTEQKIESGQISSYTDFSNIEAGIYSDWTNFVSEKEGKGRETSYGKAAGR